MRNRATRKSPEVTFLFVSFFLFFFFLFLFFFLPFLPSFPSSFSFSLFCLNSSFTELHEPSAARCCLLVHSKSSKVREAASSSPSRRLKHRSPRSPTLEPHAMASPPPPALRVPKGLREVCLQRGTYLGERFLHWDLQGWIEKSAPSEQRKRDLGAAVGAAGLRREFTGTRPGLCKLLCGEAPFMRVTRPGLLRACSGPAQTGLSIHSVPFCPPPSK